MTTRANNLPIYTCACPVCGGDNLATYQARGNRAYLYTKCPVCKVNQQPDNRAVQREMWDRLPVTVQGAIRRPVLVDEPKPAPAPEPVPEPAAPPAPPAEPPPAPTPIPEPEPTPKPKGKGFWAFIATVAAVISVIAI